MIGGEHKKERFSERLERKENQPKNRGYLPGTAPKSAGYTSTALQGNWSEERADTGYYDGKSAVPTEQEKYFRTNYQHMTSNVAAPPRQEFDQLTMNEIVDHTQSAFPGHQPHLDPQHDATVRDMHTTVSQQTLKPPKVVEAEEKAFVAPVLGGTPGAQATGVMLRLRRQLELKLPGKSAFPGNVARTVRHALEDACTDASRKVNRAELQRGLAAVGVEATDPECVALIRWYDTVGDGTAAIPALVDGLRGVLSDRREQLTKSVYDMLTTLCADGIVRLDRLAELIDVGQLDDVRGGDTAEDDARAAFVEQWDAKKADMYISLEAFLAFFADASFEIPGDSAYEIVMRNMWHLSGGSGKCANTSCRRVEVVHLNGRITKEEIKNDLAIKGSGAEVEEAIRAKLAKQGIKDVKKLRVL